ncbi:MAG TPA: NAD/NADP octopine/nopaline dehydrogenase family protein [Casimicrobiaceae bacterium]|nr:NAD/NADP octopine/nopaline dehydrogenase family protein [Casimicrobiaceae bacterium]
MNVAIIGAGAIAFGSAALIEAGGHRAGLWSPSGRGTAGLAREGGLAYFGVMTGIAHPAVIADVAEIAGYDVVLIAVPANGHRAVMERLAPHLESRHTVIVSGALSLSPLYLSKLVCARDARPVIASFGTTVLTARKTGEAAVSINVLRARLDVAAIPASGGARALDVCRNLFGERFDLAASALAIALVNINPVAHAGLALANLTRIELGEAWPQYRYLTLAVSRLIDRLDAERRAVAESFGLSVRTIEQHFEHSFDLPRAPLAEQASQLHARRGGPPGPTSLDTRFVLEDAPFGLGFTAAVARIAGVRVPLTDACLDVLSASWGRDLRADNDILPNLDLGGLDASALARLASEGFPLRR